MTYAVDAIFVISYYILKILKNRIKTAQTIALWHFFLYVCTR